jgi:hypothetical protein
MLEGSSDRLRHRSPVAASRSRVLWLFLHRFLYHKWFTMITVLAIHGKISIRVLLLAPHSAQIIVSTIMNFQAAFKVFFG